MRLTQLSLTDTYFPSPELALTDPDGLLAYGGDLRPARLLAAYQQGIFPWFSDQEPILWWSPNPRAVFFPATLSPNRSMRKWLAKMPYKITLNQAFSAVIEQCAAVRQGNTWISADICQAYTHLHQQGIAHSVEVWQGDNLVGGLYGIAMGQLFCGESMFSLQPNASKTALLVFNHHFQQAQGKLIDCQVMNPHLASLGAQTLPRTVFLQQLHTHQHAMLSQDFWHARQLDYPHTPLCTTHTAVAHSIQTRNE
ncbi:MAG: leucyl/phenylalanyl-tRNA--protein transferase [Plesiomonas sp.]